MSGPPGKYSKSISRNAHYVVAFKIPRDQLGMRNLLLQAFPTRWQDVHDTFSRVTERPFGYMLLDLHPKSDDDLRILDQSPTKGRRMYAMLPIPAGRQNVSRSHL